MEPERYLDTVVRAVSAAVLSILVGFTSLQGLPCALGPATTRRGMLVTLKLARLKGKTAAIHQALPQPLKPYMKQSQDTGASSWLNAIPKEDEDWVFSKQEFRDCVRLRYNHPIPDLPSYCVCKDKPVYTVQHAQQCSRGGFINERHDSLRDFFTVLLDKVCNGVKAEPHLTNLSGEELA